MIFRSPYPDVTISDLSLTPFVLRHAERLADRTAVIDASSGRSLTYGALAAEVRVCAPSTLMPAAIHKMGVTPFTDFDAALEGADVVMMLRLQNERMDGAYVPSTREYRMRYGLTLDRLARAAPDALVMHPGPMNRDVELSGTLADGEQSVIEQQVANGVPVRMAVLYTLLVGRR